MAKLADIRGALLRLRLKLIEHSGDRGLTVDDPEFPRKIEELDRISQTLGLCIRDLNNAQHAVAARKQNLWIVPRDQRYGPGASVAGQQREIDELIREAGEIQRLVENLLGRICAGNEMEGVHTAAELIGHAIEHEAGTAQAFPDKPAYVAHSQAHFHASLETAVIMAYVAIRGLILVSRKVATRIRS